MSGTRRKPGRLGQFVEGYRARLLQLGYTPGTVRGMLKVLGQLGRWMASEGLEPGQLDGGAIEEFIAFRRAGGDRQVPRVRALGQLLRYLRDVGVMMPAEEPREPRPLERLIADYREWLVDERGLASATVLRYEKLARRFLGERVAADDERGVENLTGAEVSTFLVRECGRVSLGAAKGRRSRLAQRRDLGARQGPPPGPAAAARRRRRGARRLPVVRRACSRAGVPQVGAHRLRHALASELLREGASLIDISQVLRRRDLATTAVYAKIDIGWLRQVAQPWPGASR